MAGVGTSVSGGGSISEPTSEGFDYDAWSKEHHVALDRGIIDLIGDQETQKILDFVDRIQKAFPQLSGTLKYIKLGKMSKHAMAQSNGASIELNPDFYKDMNALKQAYQRGVDEGFHPKGTTYDSVIHHEMGHCLVYAMLNKVHEGSWYSVIQDWSNNKWASTAQYKLIKDAFKNGLGKGKISHITIGTTISKYADKNPHECIAEAVADYISNRDKASPLSIAIWNELQKYES